MANTGENSRHTDALYVPKPIADILVEVSRIPDMSVKLSKLEFYLLSIEEELGKIHGFKNELPFCMELLKEGIETLKKKMEHCNKEKEAAREGLMEGRAKSPLDVNKRNWMSAAQLWTTPVHYEIPLDDVFPKHDTLLSLKPKFDHKEGETSGLGRGSMMTFPSRSSATIFTCVQIPVAKEEVEEPPLDLNMKDDEVWGFRGKAVAAAAAAAQPKKQRRCWSPELHKRFVGALQILGGPNAATPKQIRALMKVEGLTNDEVKSHLQKYRLHIRKLPSSLASTSGYSWVTQDENQDTPKRTMSHSGSPQDHLSMGKGGGSAVGGDSTGEDDD